MRMFGNYNVLLLCYICVCFIYIIPTTCGFLDFNIEALCRLQCDYNKVIKDTDNFYCGLGCRKDACYAGCSLYEDAIDETPCSDGCDIWVQQNSSDIEVELSNVLLVKKQSCLIGCNNGIEEYFRNVEEEYAVPRPEVFPTGITHNSVELYWPGLSPIDKLFTVLLQVLDLHTNWQNHDDYQLTTSGHLNVTNLQPFLTYKFKVLVHITTEHSLETEESAPVTTLPFGAPSSSPTIQSLIAPSSTTISISWAPPVYTNGPLLSYRLSLHSLDEGDNVMSTDVSPEQTSWIFGHLLFGQKYKIFVSAVNSDGEGPTDTRTVTTPIPNNLNSKDVPYLILGADNLVVKQNLLELKRDVDRLLKKPKSILVTGVGVHVGRELILVADDSGRITLVDINGTTLNEDIFPILSQPASIDIDWLHNYAYIADGHRIYRCPVTDSYQCKVAMDLIPYRPQEVKVDPLNGYLYYTIHESKKGLYAVDIAEFDSPGEPTSRLLIDADIETFTIDHDNLLLYYPNKTYKTVMSAYLDGTGITNTRQGNDDRAFFQGISSLVHYNRRYYWTNGSLVFGEDFEDRTYYHHSFAFLEKRFVGFNLYLPSTQPIPVPLNPPGDLEVLFTAYKAIVTWIPPQKLNFQGEGAFKQWQYEVSILQDDGSLNTLHETSNMLTFEVSNLTPDTQYQVKVRAKSKAGTGPWSPIFLGRTLKQELDDAKLIVAVKHQQYKTWEIREVGMDGDVGRTLTKTSPAFPGVKDMAWYGDKLFWTTDDRIMFMYRGDADEMKDLDFGRDAACVAFDWLGEKLYWSVYWNTQIRRADMYGKNEEFVYMARARHMTLDSVEGRLYWVTTDTVETTLLDGNEHMLYFAHESFSSKQIISLAIDYDQRQLVWYVKGPDEQSLYMADLHSYHGNNDDVISSVRLAGKIHNIDSFSVIYYLSQRLLWIDSTQRVRVGNALGNHMAAITATDQTVSMVTVKHQSLHRYPAGLNSSTVCVIPNAVPSSTMRCQGVWSKFNITWRPSAEVNHGIVMYAVSVQVEGVTNVQITQNAWYEMSGLVPYTLINVYIQAYTVWGTSQNTTTTVRSPMAAPSKPVAPKVYVTQRKNAASSKLTLAADFRWSEPTTLNGVLSKQNVYYWQSDKPKQVSSTSLSASSRHFILDEIQGNITYFFQVESCTLVGCGPRSDAVNATTNAVNPVPKLLIATTSGILVAEADNVNSTSVTMATKSVVALGHLSQEDAYFWVTRDGYLEQSNFEHLKLFHLEGEGHHMTLDWVSRSVYATWSSDTAGVIIRHQIDTGTQAMFIERSAKIGDIVVDPYTSSLVWSEYDSGSGSYKIYRSRTSDSSSTQPFFQHQRQRRDVASQCNCPSDLTVGSTLIVDLNQDGLTELVFVNSDTLTLMAADMNACKCRILLNTTANDRKGLLADHVTVDHVYIYWYQASSERLYMLDKASGTVSFKQLSDVTDILAFGAHLQPLPGPECLDTTAYADLVDIVMVTNTSVKVRLQEVTWPDWCTNMSHPTVKYTVYYKVAASLHDDCQSNDNCQSKESYSREITLDNLNPYTSYIIQGAVSNYYSEYTAQSLGNSTAVTTKPGVPSPVDNFTVLPKNPNSIVVMWPPSHEPNGPADKIVYFVKWTTQLEDGIHDRMSDAIMYDSADPYNNGLFMKEISGLEADQTYLVKVIANQTSGNFVMESFPMSVHTFEPPSDIELLDVTNTSIHLTWRSPSDNATSLVSINYAEVKDDMPEIFFNKMDDLPFVTENYTLYNGTFTGLRPNMEYSFQLSIIYKAPASYELYHWPPPDMDLEFVYKTLTGIPGSPDPPVVQELKEREFEVTWTLPENNGEKITHFILQYKYIDKDNWSIACNTTELRWVIDEMVLQRGYTYMFRVMAENAKGWGPVSLNSTLFSYPILEAEPANGMTTVVAVVSAFVFVVISMAIIAICFSMCRRRREEKKKESEFVAVTRGPDLELATLRELPMTAIQQNNTLYAMNLIPTDDEIAALPHFRRDQLVLCKFLGSGAFGEVFEGIAKNILNESSGDTRCAVKTLRKSASDQEKEEFLKEALLMSNFHHEHILSLLGVCLDNDPQFIILELMEGGDLLSFMRACRLSSIQTQNRAELSLTDIVKICVHVASGCKYLEDMHFVHRDLAARNCLVSSLNPSTMVVKIGDFGLARDIYKNDYYRKEGEGLLPVRWMSPESLVDGVFTTQSDIWAFGVLMWEVVTFGQQPYPARTNIEVLHFVRSSGRLDRPDNCPDDFYQLMCKCWSYAPEERPTFAYLLQQLEKFHETCLSVSEYLIPIRSNNRPIAMAAGYKYLTGRQRRLTSTSSDGPDYTSIHHNSYGSHNSYGKIRRATSFDSPEPKDATQQVQTDSANYLEPKSRYLPTYVEFHPEDRTINYVYGVDGRRMRDLEKNNTKSNKNNESGPLYVQTTVRENFLPKEQDYVKYVNQKTSSTSDQENDSEVKRIFSHTKNSADSVIMKTVENIPNECMNGKENKRNSITSCSDLFSSQILNSSYAHCTQNNTHRPSFRKQRLDSSNSVKSFDSVQTEPVYSSYHRSKLYSSSSSKSNYSMSNISESAVEQLSPPAIEQLSPDPMAQQFWANNSTDRANLVNKKLEMKQHIDYLNLGARSQVYPENAGPLAGYDIVHASLV